MKGSRVEKKLKLAELERRIKDLEKEAQERKVAENALRAAEVQYKEIFNVATDAFVIFDFNGNIVEANPQACKMHGYAHKEFIKLPGKGMVHPHYHHLFEQFQRDVKTTGEFQAEAVNVRKDGTPFDIEVRGTDFNYKGKKHLLAIIRDVSERKRSEEALRRSERELQILSSKLLSVQEDEKKRIARELHDSFGQVLTAIKFGIENSLQEIKRGDSRSIGKSLQDIIPIVQRAMEDIRRVTMELRPTILDNQGIISTLRWFCQGFHKVCPTVRTKVKISVQEERVPQPLKITIYRILQEAFTNIAKHSQARLVNLHLGKKGNTLELIIRDNGTGFDLENILSAENSKRGFGLSSMRERTKLSGGYFLVESHEGKGTTIRASWPLDPI